MRLYKTSNTRWLPWLLMTALILLSACQPAESGTSGTRINEDSTASGAVFSPAAGEFKLPDPAVGLDQLNAYTALLTVKFEGQRDGSPLSWTRTYRMKVQAESRPARQVEVLVQSGSAAAETRLLAAEGGGQQAVVEANAACQTAGLDEVLPLSARWEPARFLPAVAGAETDGEEELNGIPSRRYIFDERALGLSGLTNSDGAFWLAEESGTLLRYTLAQQAGVDYFGEGVSGTVTWEYELSLENSTPVWPEGCDLTSTGLDLPLPSDAADIDSSAGMLSFLTQTAPEDITAFYEPVLAAAGWLPGAGENVSSMTDSTLGGLSSLLDEETLKQLAELEAELQDEDFDTGDPAEDVPDIDPSSGGLKVYHREGQELTLSILPEDSGWSVILTLLEP